MPGNRTPDVVAPPSDKRWRDSLRGLSLVRLVVFFGVLHLGWNFTEGGVFGVSISGGPAVKGIFSVSLAGRTLLTGGKFGPEASIVAIAVCLAAALVLLVVIVRKGGWMPIRRLPSRA